MPTIYDGQLKDYFTVPTTSNGVPKFGFGFRKKKGPFNNLYNGGAWRDFGNNIVLGSGNKKEEFTAQVKQQEKIDKIISKSTPRTKAEITGSGFKMC
jgi:hypothetical protein